jgi:hypothetical protein
VTAGCTRAAEAEAARVGQPGLAVLLEDEAHVGGCGECQAALAGYQRMIAAIGELSSAAKRRPDHVARALATATMADEKAARAAASAAATPASATPGWQRTTRLAAPLLAVAAAMALLMWFKRERGPEEHVNGADGGAPDGAVGKARFAFEIVAKDKPVLRGDAQLGDTLRVRTPAGSSLWVYRNDRALLLVCPRDCRRQGEGWIGEVTLDAIGHYQLVWISTEAAPAPSGELERDIAAAHAAGATYQLQDLDVQ